MGSQEFDPLDALRVLMSEHSPPLHALVVPSEDSHQSEYTADYDKRRQFVSGFSGSAGVAVITESEALLWTDGRYFLQASQQLSNRWKLMRIGEDPTLEIWLADNLGKNTAVGVDPWVISVDTATRWMLAFPKNGPKLVPLEHNLVDKVWKDRPAAEIIPVFHHPLQFTGRTAKDKIADLRTSLAGERAFAILLTTLDEVAWLYNLRGGDVLYNPVFHAFAIITHESAYLFVDKRKVCAEVEEYLKENAVELRDYNDILQDVEALCSGTPIAKQSGIANISKEEASEGESIDKELTIPDGTVETESVSTGVTTAEAEDREGKSWEENVANGSGTNNGSLHQTKEGRADKESQSALIWVDPATCSYNLYLKIPSDRILLQQSPLALAKALKHSVELDGLRQSHIRDGAAVVSHLAWLDSQMQEIYGAAGYCSEVKDSHKRKRLESEKLTEITVSDKLEEFRSKQEHFRGLSFETISAVGSNGAIIHYAAKAETCAEMQADSMYLCDSGAQYLDGTTDITRTVHFGKPTAHEKACFTQVLKGHIALDSAVFPNGTTGHALDILARVPLWKGGLDYRHGTGHGVGCYLNVHEGPHLISFRPQARNVALQSSMTVTDEPGYYEEGNFGVRIENVLIVKEAQVKYNFGDKGYLAFEHITWVPYQMKLMDLSILLESEKDWIDDYHRTCREKLSSYLSGATLEWLIKATEPLPR